MGIKSIDNKILKKNVIFFYNFSMVSNKEIYPFLFTHFGDITFIIQKKKHINYQSKFFRRAFTYLQSLTIKYKYKYRIRLTIKKK